MHIDAGLRMPPGGIVVVSPIDGARTTTRTLPADVKLKKQEKGVSSVP